MCPRIVVALRRDVLTSGAVTVARPQGTQTQEWVRKQRGHKTLLPPAVRFNHQSGRTEQVASPNSITFYNGFRLPAFWSAGTPGRPNDCGCPGDNLCFAAIAGCGFAWRPSGASVGGFSARIAPRPVEPEVHCATSNHRWDAVRDNAAAQVRDFWEMMPSRPLLA
jgi:hypothetical protein